MMSLCFADELLAATTTTKMEMNELVNYFQGTCELLPIKELVNYFTPTRKPVKTARPTIY